MRLSSLLFVLILVGLPTFVVRANKQEPPPPPSSEYFPQKWVDYTSQAGRFKIKFPQTPRESSEMQGSDDERSRVYLAEYKGLLLYVASYADATPLIVDARATLGSTSQQWLQANAARSLTVIKNEEISFAGNPAKFLQVETPREVVRVRWIIVKNRVYYQFVAAPKHKNAMESENGYEKLATAFFESFELTN